MLINNGYKKILTILSLLVMPFLDFSREISNFLKNQLLTRQTNDRYYEAKLGIGDLLAGFFRIGMIEEGKEKQLSNFDFSH